MTAKQTRARAEEVADRLRGIEVTVRFVYDDDAHFEECNGQSRPLTEEEYAKDFYMACPRHPRVGSKVINQSPPVQGCAVCGNTQYEPISYAEYLDYYGNPANHVYLGMIKEQRPINCGCDEDSCECWDSIDSVWGIDLMADDPVLDRLEVSAGRLTLAEARALSDYLAELVE